MSVTTYLLSYAPFPPSPWGRLPALLMRADNAPEEQLGLRRRELAVLLRDGDAAGWAATPDEWVYDWRPWKRAFELTTTVRRVMVREWSTFNGAPSSTHCHSCGTAREPDGRQPHKRECSYWTLGAVLKMEALLPWACLSCGRGWRVAAWWSAAAVPLAIPCPCGTPEIVPLWGPVGMRWAYAMTMFRTHEPVLHDADKALLAKWAYQYRAAFGLPWSPCSEAVLAEIELVNR